MSQKKPATKKQRDKVRKVMHEFEEGELPIGRSKKKVKSRRQAIAIALSEAGLSRRQDSSIKYEEGAHLSHLIPSNTSAAYSASMLSVLRGDAKKRVRVNAPHTKQGYYYRNQEVSGRPTGKRNPVKVRTPALPQRPPQRPGSEDEGRGGGGPGIGVIAGLALGGAALSAAGGALAATWMTAEGTRQQVNTAKANADAKIEKEVAKVKKEAETAQAEAVANATKAAESKFQKEFSKTQKAAESNLKQKVKEIQKEVEAKFKPQVADLETKLTQSETQRQKAEQDLDNTKSKSAQVEEELQNRIKQIEGNIQEELERRTAQIENRINSEALQQIEKQRLAALDQQRQAIQDEQDKRLAGSTGTGKIISSESGGIELAASVRRKLDLSTVAPDILQRRFDDAVDKLAGDRLKKAMADLAPEFTARAKEIRSGASRDFKRKWQDMEAALIQQTNRENGLTSSVSDIRRDYKKQHREALDGFLKRVEGRGSFDNDLITAFDKELTKLNKAMQASITNTVKEVRDSTPLDKPFLGR